MIVRYLTMRCSPIAPDAGAFAQNTDTNKATRAAQDYILAKSFHALQRHTE